MVELHTAYSRSMLAAAPLQLARCGCMHVGSQSACLLLCALLPASSPVRPAEEDYDYGDYGQEPKEEEAEEKKGSATAASSTGVSTKAAANATAAAGKAPAKGKEGG